jgi:drug/metabolite transporter (DMT)-like permease
MSLAVFLAVLFAALLHASWNAIVKLGLDRFSSVLLLTLAQGVIAAAALPWFAPPAPESWPWIAVGGVLHAGYNIFLIRAYQHGDLSQIYPLARGTAPLIVAVVSGLWLEEPISALRLGAILLIAGGVMMMARRTDRSSPWIGPGVLAALVAACFTASYTLADGYGARLSGSVSGFTMILFVLDGVVMLAYGLAVRGWAGLAALKPAIPSGTAAGAMSLGSYWIAMWAFTMAPLAAVAALRETSVLFAMLIAAFVLRERIGGWRWAAAGLILAGVALMRL